MVAGFESFRNWFQGYEDVFRLSALLGQNTRVDLSDEIREDMTASTVSQK